MKRILFSIVTLTAIAAIPAFADVDNGLFLPGGSTSTPFYTPVGSGPVSGTIPGWAVTGTSSTDSVDWIGTYWEAPPSGGYSVDLDGDSDGGITQSVILGVGTYALSYYVSGNPDGLPTVKSYDVATGALVTPETVSDAGVSRAAMGFVLNTIDFTVTTPGATTIAFTSTDTPGSSYGAVIGGVSLVQTPEPSFYYQSAAYALGLSGLLFFVRRKRLSL